MIATTTANIEKFNSHKQSLSSKYFDKFISFARLIDSRYFNGRLKMAFIAEFSKFLYAGIANFYTIPKKCWQTIFSRKEAFYFSSSSWFFFDFSSFSLRLSCPGFYNVPLKLLYKLFPLLFFFFYSLLWLPCVAGALLFCCSGHWQA